MSEETNGMASMKRVIGMMSGTSADGVDAAMIVTDGESRVDAGEWLTIPYDRDSRAAIRSLDPHDEAAIAEIEVMITRAHVAAVSKLLAESGVAARDIDAIGFHGHTVLHRPEIRLTRQIGDGHALAHDTGIDVVCDFRGADVGAGGEGAPLAPLYHRALATPLEKPLAVLNLGGVGNVTWLGADAVDILAFDTGPANALLDDWADRHTGLAVDIDGALAAAGTVNDASLTRLMSDSYFAKLPPKSLDRDHFGAAAAMALEGLSAEDGAATLAAFTVASVARAAEFFAAPATRWLVCGGGRHNPVLMKALAARLGVPVDPVESVGWQGDALEAQAFAYLAVRSLTGLPITLPTTTGGPVPMTGGVLCHA
jgi:anhydro-N-acetylmuramic acid kinase